MAENTYLGCNIKIWMYIVVSVTVFVGILDVYQSIYNFDKTDNGINKTLSIAIPVIFLSAAILGFIATFSDNKCLLLPLLIILVVLIPLIIVYSILFYILCMSQSECKGDSKNFAITTTIFVTSLIVCVCTMQIVCRYYRQMEG